MIRDWVPRFVLAIVVGVTVVGHAGARGQEAELNPVTWAVKGQLPGAPLKAGDSFKVDLSAKIDRGWHLYSTNAIENGPRPTRITIVADQGFELAGKVDAPAPIVAKDPNFGVETEYYEEAVTFTVPVKVTPNAAPGKSSVTVQVRYQSCSDKLCLPPRVVKLPAAVEIAAK